MLSASTDFKRAIAQNTKTLVKATLTLADGTTSEVVGDDLMMGSPSFSDSVSSASSFDVGAAIIGKFSVSLNNCDGRFDDYDFEGATIAPHVGVRLGDEVEWLRKGTYRIEQPETYGNVIRMTALDNMSLLERPYSEVTTSYPATLATIAQDIADECGVVLATQAFANGSFVVQERPDDQSVTCLAMLAYVAQASGNWARCDVWGRIRLDWYDTSAFDGEDWLDGDGGESADGGDFSQGPWAHVFALASLTVSTDDVVVTGVRATAQDGGGGQGGESSLYGSEGYVIELPDNPLVQYGSAATVAAQVGARVVGMRFRPFDISALGDPTLEAGDPIVITDAKQRHYRSYITTLTYKVGSYEAMACNAESPGRNRASSYSALTRAIVKLRNADKAERTARETAVASLAQQLAQSSGLYMTTVPQQDGSTIYYMHDKPTLAGSMIVWKLTANAFGISTDGGATYPYGLDANGDAILNRIYAIGLNADYINAGTLTIRDGSTTVLSASAATGVVTMQDASGNFWNLHTGELRMAATSTIGGRTVSQVLDAVDATVTGVSVEYAQNQSNVTPPTTGWSTSSPTWREGYYIWQRIATTSGGSTTYSNVVCISGRDGSSGTNASTIYLYQRSATAPAKPSATLTYTFATGELTGSTGSWTRGIPDGSSTCWVIVATAISNGATDTITPGEWSDPVELASGGVDGLNQATIYLHKRARAWNVLSSKLEVPSPSMASVSGSKATVAGTVSGETLSLASEAPAAPSGTLNYTFASGALAGNLEGWSRGVPDGEDPCWVTTAVAISSEAMDPIAPSEWAEVVKLAEDGIALGIVSVEWAVGASDATPPADGWQDTIPSVPDGSWLWTRTTYSDGTATLVCSYRGIGIVNEADQYYLSTSDREPTGGAWGMTQPEWESGKYIWKRKALTWSDGSTTYTEPIPYSGVNNASAVAYRASEAVVTLDQELDQEGVFNRLTNDGQVQGIYIEDGQLYVNASYIRTGIMNASLIRTGALVVSRNDRTVFSANLETGVVSIDADCITVGSTSLSTTISSMRAQYGTCSTAATTRAKVVTCENFSLRTGATVSVKFTYANGISSPTLNVNGTGSKAIQLNGESLPEKAWWGAGEVVTFVYDGTSWALTDGSAVAQTITNKDSISTLTSTAQQLSLSIEGHTETITQLKAVFCVSTTAAATQEKAATCSGFALRTGAIVSVRFSYGNSASSPKLNVNGTGAKAIQLNGSALPQANWWGDGEVVTLVYDGSAWSVVDGSTLRQLQTTADSVASLRVRADTVEATVSGVQATYGTCSTEADTQLKEVTIANFKKYVGQTVTVRFTNANTASSPRLKVQNSDGSEYATGYIYVNGSYMNSDTSWAAGGVVTFVWDGSYWRVGDGSTLSKIKLLRDSLELSVTNGTLGSSATIKLMADGTQLGSATMNLTGVRNAFKNDTTAIVISAGTVKFDSNTLIVNSTNFKVTSNGNVTASSATLDGTFTCGDTYKVKLQDGTMYGYQSGSQVGYIDYTASSTDLDTGATRKGIQIQAVGIVRISSPRISVAATSNVSTTATFGKTGTMRQQLVKSIRDAGGGSISWTYGTMEIEFINGLCVSWSIVS